MGIMRTTIKLDDELLAEAQRLTGTREAAVRLARLGAAA